MTFQPNAVAVSGDVLTCMQTMNQYCRDLAAAGHCIVLDLQLMFGGSTLSYVASDLSDYDPDKTHLSPQGHAKAAVAQFNLLF